MKSVAKFPSYAAVVVRGSVIVALVFALVSACEIWSREESVQSARYSPYDYAACMALLTTVTVQFA